MRLLDDELARPRREAPHPNLGSLLIEFLDVVQRSGINVLLVLREDRPSWNWPRVSRAISYDVLDESIGISKPTWLPELREARTSPSELSRMPVVLRFKGFGRIIVNHWLSETNIWATARLKPSRQTQAS